MNMAVMKAPEKNTFRRVALLNDTSAWYHWGCSCTSYGMRSEIGRRGFEVDPISISETYRCEETPNKIADYRDEEFFRRFCAANTALMKRLAAAEVVVVNGEGTLHGTGKVARNLLYLAYTAKTRLGRPVHIINHSCYPEDKAELSESPAVALYKLVYGAMDFVAVREPLSAEIVTGLGANPVQAFDCLPFYVGGRRDSWSGGQRQGVVLAGGVSLRADMIPMLASLIAELRRRRIPVSVLIGAAANPAVDDKKFVEALRDAMPTGWELIDARSEDAWLRTIAEAKLLISGRFHHTIAAACMATPAIAFDSNTPKIDGMLAMLGLPPALRQSAEDREARLRERVVQTLSAEPPAAAAENDALWEKMREYARRNFEGLDSIAARASA
jgi:polysaccharide pyruvyl transferase WcaK-like protein